MHAPFASERARAQVGRILDYVAFPGLAILFDAELRVVGAAGSVGGCTAEEVARVLGHAPQAIVHDTPGWLGEHHRVATHALPAGHRLCLVVPQRVVPAVDRLERAAALLARMLRPTSSPDQGGGPAAAERSLPTLPRDERRRSRT